MRTTISIDDDILSAAKALADAEEISLGAALSKLARRGLSTLRGLKSPKGNLPYFDVPADARMVTPEMIQDALDDDQ